MPAAKNRIKNFYVIRWGIKCLMGLFIFFLILELTLQITSLIENRKLNKQFLIEKVRIKNTSNHKDNKQIRILCVGDSFTQGVGASSRDKAYPAQLQAYLKRNSSFLWEVFNCGIAGNRSLQLLYSLPGLLEFYSPRYVLVLIGVNEFCIPDLKKEKFSEKNYSIRNKETQFIPWRLRFRTYRLYRRILKYIKDVQIAKNNFSERTSNGIFNRGVIEKNNNAQELMNPKKNLVFEKGRKVVSVDKNYLNKQMRLLRHFMEQKMFEDAEKQARLIREEILDMPSHLHIELAQIFLTLQQLQYAYDEIAQVKKFSPNDERINEALGNFYFNQYNYDTAEVYFIKSINEQPQRTLPYRELSRIYSVRDHNLDESLKLLVKAYLIDKNIEETINFLLAVKTADPFSTDYFEKIMNKSKQELNIDASSYKKLSEIIKIIGDDTDTQDILTCNLAEIVALCLRYKAIPVFLTYPCFSKANLATKDFCLRRSELVIDAEGYFNDLRRTDKFEKYFVADSHLNNEGYRVFAEKVGEEILKKIYSAPK